LQVDLWPYSRDTGHTQREVHRDKRERAEKFKQLKRRQRQVKRGFVQQQGSSNTATTTAAAPVAE
jgi:ribosomal protein L44E